MRRLWFRLAPIVFLLAWVAAAPAADVVLDRPQRVKDVLVVNADGDLTVAADVRGSSGATIVMAASGDIHVAAGVSILGGDFVMLSAGGNVDLGDGVRIATHERDGAAGAKVDASGSIVVGSGLRMTSGMVRLGTRPGGGSITVGPGALLVAGDTAEVTAAGDVSLDDADVRAPTIFMTAQHAGVGGVLSLTGTVLRARDDLVLEAASGPGSLLDVRGMTLRTPRSCSRTMLADRILH